MQKIEFKLCISCLTFNHSKYIEDALNGFVMQQTDFPFVCIIIDDASTDGEPEVINHYLDEHFDMSGLPLLPDSYVSEGEVSDYVAMGQRNFQLTEHAAPWRCDAKEGVYTFAQHKTNKNCFVLSLNLKKNLYGVKDSKVKLIAPWEQTQYVALCEGDDYWTDPYKLQKQVDFLEGHEDVGLCYTDCDIYFEKENRFKRHILADEDGAYLTDNPLKNQIHDYTANMTWVYRRSVSQQIKPNPGYLDGAVYLLLSICAISKIGFVPGVTGVYRRHEGSASCFSKTDLEKQYRFDRSMFMLLNDLQPKLEDSVESLRKIYSDALFDLYIRARERNDVEIVQMFEQYFDNKINLEPVNEFIDKYNRAMNVRNSNAYKLGKFMLKPFSILRDLF